MFRLEMKKIKKATSLTRDAAAGLFRTTRRMELNPVVEIFESNDSKNEKVTAASRCQPAVKEPH